MALYLSFTVPSCSVLLLIFDQIGFLENVYVIVHISKKHVDIIFKEKVLTAFLVVNINFSQNSFLKHFALRHLIVFYLYYN